MDALDPTDITNYNLTNTGLELHLCFWVCVAGKTARVIAPAIDRLFRDARKRHPHLRRPFSLIKKFGSQERLRSELLSRGIGGHGVKSRGLWELAHSNINLRTCTVAVLEAFHGIGPKTARCFILHTRPDQPLAGLDTHMRAHLGELGFTGSYEFLEQKVLELAKAAGMSPAAYDLMIWNQRSRRVTSRRAS